MKSKFLSALAVLVGTAVGAGFLGIPYVIAKTGFLIGVVLLITIALFILFLNLCFGEVILRTKGNHQLTGYAEKYLGKKGKWLMFIAMMFGMFPALIAHILAEGNTLSYIFTGTENLSIYFSMGFWVLMAFLSYIGLKALKKVEKISMFIVIGIIIVLVSVFIPTINVQNLTSVDVNYFFLPLGVILYSFLAFSAMPEVKRLIRGSEDKMKKAIILGVVIPFFVYLLFTLVSVGNFGQAIPQIAILAFGRVWSILAVMTLFTGFFVLSIATRDMFRFDFNTGRFVGWLMAVFIPLVLFLLIHFFHLASFVQILGFAGVISGGLTGICILIMNLKAKKLGNRHPEYIIGINWLIIILLSLILIIAVILECLFYKI